MRATFSPPTLTPTLPLTRCLDSMGLRQCMVLVDSIQAESVLVHFQGGVQPNEWVPLATHRLTPPADDDEKSAWEDDDHCQVSPNPSPNPNPKP